jgi:Tol biopolymer transport system component
MRPAFSENLIVPSLGLMLLTVSCGQPSAPVADVTASRAQTPGAAPYDNEQPISGLRLFGRDLGATDVAFEGKAASDLRQHTTPSAGADFDPDIDPTGKRITYASTRHAPNSHLYIKSIHGATITQITDGPGNDAQPEFDPQGNRIVFASDRGGHWDIWVVDANGRNPIQITNNPMPELHPSWSPDGKSVVYCRIDPKAGIGSLWVVSLENPGVKRLIGEGLFPAWSPRGDKIAYQRARSMGSPRFSVWTIDINEDEVLFPTEVATSPAAALIAPTWSPDGSQLAFSILSKSSKADTINGVGAAASHVRGRSDIGIVDVDGRGLQRLTSGDAESFSPTWSSTGRIYFSRRSSGSETIWSVRPFRPVIFDEAPSATSSSPRRAARISDTDLE